MQFNKNEELVIHLQSSSQMPKELSEIGEKNKSLLGLNEEQKKQFLLMGNICLFWQELGLGKPKLL